MPEDRTQEAVQETAVEESGAPQTAAAETPVMQTREGRAVQSVAHILAIMQIIGLMMLVGAMVTYHSNVSDDVELRGYASADNAEIVETADVMVGPWIFGVPALAIFVAAVAYGLWHVRGWGRRLGMLLALMLVATGIGIGQLAQQQIDRAWLMSDIESDALFGGGDDEAEEELTANLLKAGTGLAVFYGLVFGILLMPSVGRVFRTSDEQLRRTEARFKIQKDESRDHFEVDHDVAQL